MVATGGSGYPGQHWLCEWLCVSKDVAMAGMAVMDQGSPSQLCMFGRQGAEMACARNCSGAVASGTHVCQQLGSECLSLAAGRIHIGHTCTCLYVFSLVNLQPAQLEREAG